ncbi:hypothetical protein [Curtobacterium sp. NPDC092190]|uniref:hypothetical protein n=1 Tax=Curtobacterium sp. NPDC092190 TaxID=3363973 RepID=UPI00382780AF
MPGRRHALVLQDRRAVRIVALVLLALAAAYQCFWRIADENTGGDESTYVRAGFA